METKKKLYEVELKRTSYIIVTVEADDIESAETEAFNCTGRINDDDANWEVESIEELNRED